MKEYENLIFLDMDGVLNCGSFYEDWRKSRPGDGSSFFEQYCMAGGVEGYVVPELLDRFVCLCDRTDAGIVWSSSWRINYERGNGDFDEDGIRRLWTAKGLPFDRYVGCVPVIDFHRMSYVPRFLEIRRWLEANPQVKYRRAAVLDDDYDAWRLDLDHWDVVQFQTTWSYGLTEEIAVRAEDWLSRGSIIPEAARPGTMRKKRKPKQGESK